MNKKKNGNKQKKNENLISFSNNEKKDDEKWYLITKWKIWPWFHNQMMIITIFFYYCGSLNCVGFFFLHSKFHLNLMEFSFFLFDFFLLQQKKKFSLISTLSYTHKHTSIFTVEFIAQISTNLSQKSMKESKKKKFPPIYQFFLCSLFFLLIACC